MLIAGLKKFAGSVGLEVWLVPTVEREVVGTASSWKAGAVGGKRPIGRIGGWSAAAGGCG